MPVIRMPADTSLGDTLGNLGRSLSEGLNPLNRLRGLDIQQQIWMRNQQLLQAQREANAKRLAIQHYGHLVPPDALPEIANMIYQNAPPDQIGMRAAQLSGRLVDDPSDAGTNQNIQTLQRDFGIQWKEAYPPVAGAATQANRLKIEAAQAGAVTGAQKQAETDVQIKNAPGIATAEGLKAGAVAQGQNIAKQTAIDTLTKAQVDDPAHDATNRQIAQAIEALGGPKAPEPGFTVPVGPNTNAIYQKEQATQAGSKSKSTAAGTAAGGGISTNDQKIFPQGLPGSPGNPVVGGAPAASANTTQPVPAPAPAQPAQPAPPAPAPAQLAPTVSVPNPASPAAPPTPVVRAGPDGMAITGQSAPETAATTEVTKQRNDVLTQAMDEGLTAARLKVKLGQLRDLSTIAQTGGTVGQINAAVAKRLAEAGYVVGDRASALKAMDQILNTEIPDLRKASGITRLAGPEITAVGKQIGSAGLPPQDLMNIIANEEAAADAQIQRRANALQASGLGNQPMSYSDFVNADTDLTNTLRAHTDALRQQYGAIGTTSQAAPVQTAAPPPPQTAGGGNPVTDALAAVAHWFTGGGSQAAPTAPAAPSVELDPNTGLPKAQ